MRGIAYVGILLVSCGAPNNAGAVTADLLFCSERPDKSERLACYEAAARIASAQNNQRVTNPRPAITPRQTHALPPAVEPNVVAVSAPAAAAYAKSVAPIAPTATNWSGCYLGVHAGGSLVYDTMTEENGGGAIAGGQAGCNYQIGRLVPGVEVNGSWSSARSNSFEETNAVGLFVSSKRAFQNRWTADIALRLGLAVTDHTLIYGKVGGAVAKFDWNQSSIFSVGGPTDAFASGGSNNLFGVLIGAGSEFAVHQNWSAKFEYTYVNYLSDNFNITNCNPILFGGCQSVNRSESADQHFIKLGVNYYWWAIR